jgi:hypothetical protein
MEVDLSSKQTGPRGPWKKFPVANMVVVEELTQVPDAVLQVNEII